MTTYSLCPFNSIVIEVGSHETKFGMSGEDTPRMIIPSFACNGGGSLFFGSNSFDYPKHDNYSVTRIMNEGKVVNWEAYEKLVKYAIEKLSFGKTTEYPILLVEAPDVLMDQREKICEILFEKFNVPGVFMLRSPVANIYNAGKISGLVLDIGATMTYSTVVSEGNIMYKAFRKVKLGGDILDNDMLTTLQETHNLDVKSHYQVVNKIDSNGKHKPLLKPDPSFHKWKQLELARSIKESICQVNENKLSPATIALASSKEYKLPDGQLLTLTGDRLRVPELFFDPKPLKREDIPSSIPFIVSESLKACELDVRREAIFNFVFAGGGCNIPGMQERVVEDLSTLILGQKVKPIISQVPTERRTSSWIGGSIIASTSTFPELAISYEDFLDHGLPLLAKKCM